MNDALGMNEDGAINTWLLGWVFSFRNEETLSGFGRNFACLGFVPLFWFFSLGLVFVLCFICMYFKNIHCPSDGLSLK